MTNNVITYKENTKPVFSCITKSSENNAYYNIVLQECICAQMLNTHMFALAFSLTSTEKHFASILRPLTAWSAGENDLGSCW